MTTVFKVKYNGHLPGSLAQLVEQRLEEPCVPSSSLGGATIEIHTSHPFVGFSYCVGTRRRVVTFRDP